MELAARPDPLRAARLHYEIGRLYECPLRDLRRAAAHYQEALSRAPEHLPTLRGARRTLIARKSYQAALPLYDAEARITSDPRQKAAIYLAKGRLLEDALGNKAEARAAYATALELDRDDPSILKAIEQCDLEAERWDGLARTYERAANAVADDAHHRAVLIVQRAHLLERQGAVDAAIELYETSLKLDPFAPGALEALKRLHHGQRRFRDSIRVLELESQQTGDATVRTMALYRIGRLHAERLGSRREALAALERAVRESPREPLVLAELARLYDEAEQWEALVEVLTRLVDATREADERLGLLHRIGQLCEEKLEQDDSAVHWYESALRIQPAYVPALQALAKLYVRRDAWEPLVRMHLAEAEATEDAQRRAAAHARVAEILEAHLNRREEAIEHHSRALALVPGYPPSFKALARLLAESNRWRDLAELYERAVDQAPEKEQAITYLLKIGAVYEDALGEHGQAAHTYRRILALDSDHLGAIHALQRATERAGRFQELVEALELEADKTKSTAHVVALLHRAGEILDEKLGDRDAALVRFRKVLELDPRYVPGLSSLGRIYYRMGRWEDLLDTYKRELDLVVRGPQAIALLEKMGELCEVRIGRDDEALGYYRRAIEMDPTHGSAIRALSRMLRDRGKWDELVKILELELGAMTDPQARARAAFRVGEVYEERLDQIDRAIAAYEQSVRAVPDYRPAIDALARLRADTKAWPKLVEDLERDATTTPDPSLAISALIRQGEIWRDELAEPRRAIACFERVLERDPGHVGALLALESLYRRIGAWESLASTYVTESHVLSDSRARIAALRELARLQEVRGVGTPEDRHATYGAILAISPNDPAALEALERIALEHGNREMLAEVDARLGATAEDPIVAAAYQTRLAESLEAIGDPNAIDAYRAALARDAEAIGATRGLSRLAERLDDPVVLAEAARREASVAREGHVAAKLLVRSASVRSDRIGDFDGALADLERALELAPDHAEAAERLTNMLMARGQKARLADLLARAAASAQSPDRVAALWMQVARIQADHLDNVAAAIGSLNRVLRAAPHHVPTLRALADLYARDGQWTEAVNLLGRVVQLAPDRDVLRAAHLRLAAIWDERLGETSRALVSLQAVLALDPKNREALERLSALQEREGKIAQAVDAASKLVEITTNDPEGRAAALVRLARLHRRLGHGEEATASLRKAVALEGPGTDAAIEIKSSAASMHDWEQYVAAIDKYLARSLASGQPAASAFLEIARVRQDNMGQTEAALEILRKGIEATGDLGLRTELASRLRAARRHAQAVGELQSLVEDDVSRPESWRDLVRTYGEMGWQEEARLAAMALAVLGAANDRESALLREVASNAGRARPGGLAGDTVTRLGGYGPAELAAAELLVVLESGLGKLYPPDLDAYGLSGRDRVTTRSGHPTRQLAEAIAHVFGVGEFDLFVHRVRTKGMAVELGSPTAILVPASLTELPMQHQIFMLARPLASLAQRLHPLDKLTPRELEVLLASAARTVSPGYGAGLTSEDFLDEQNKRIHKALSRRARKALEESAARYVAAQKVDFPRWCRAVQLNSNRVAAVLADDLVAAVDMLRRTERELVGMDGVALARSSDSVSDLLAFWASDTAMRLRQHLGLLPQR